MTDMERIFESLRNSYNKKPFDLKACLDHILHLKTIFAAKPSLIEKEEQILIETLEVAALVALSSSQKQEFERYASEVKQYYHVSLRVSTLKERSCAILGLYLLYLLVEDRIGAFHTELELVPSSLHSNKYISYGILLERCMMEGNYTKIVEMSKVDPPMAEFRVFMDELCHRAKELAERAVNLVAEEERSLHGLRLRKAGADIFPEIEKFLGYAADIERII